MTLVRQVYMRVDALVCMYVQVCNTVLWASVQAVVEVLVFTKTTRVRTRVEVLEA
jgi:hypothetical protein